MTKVLSPRQVLNRAVRVPFILSLLLAVYFATQGEWIPVIVLVMLSLVTLSVVYPWYKRQLATRDAAAAETNTTGPGTL